MEIVTIEKKTFEEMKSRFNQFSEHVRQLCSRYRPPEKMNWLDNADVCEKLNVSKRTLQTYRDGGLLAYSQINHKIYYRLEDVEAFITAMSKNKMEVITKDMEEVQAYFEALERSMKYVDNVTANFRPAMNGEVYLTGKTCAGYCISLPALCRTTGRKGLSRSLRCRAKRCIGNRTYCVCWKKTMCR